ncbi:hypothetical protein D7V90_11655 [bacterium 1xD42-87]|nr:hypothetical protein D7V90_11655 [bacterium 1xD42-87]
MVKRNKRNWFRHGSWWKRLRNNRKYRDVLFRHLFREKKDLLELYNALNGSTYQNLEELEVITMEDVIFMKMKNDLSFMIGNTLNLYEHQSTWNANMPLRGMLYFAQQFEGLLASREDDIYGTKRVELPTPVYIVFYNGAGMQTDNLLLYLSDAFPTGRGSGCLECTCEVLNINRGYNRALMEKCHRLWEYSEFSSEIEENIKKGMRREEAVHTAIDTCIEKGILRDILVKQKAEVLHMILTEYDEKKHFRTLFREGKEEGIKEGMEKGIEKGIEIGLTRGREENRRELVRKKLAKGKPVPAIAEELEEDVSVIEEIVNDLNA